MCLVGALRGWCGGDVARDAAGRSLRSPCLLAMRRGNSGHGERGHHTSESFRYLHLSGHAQGANGDRAWFGERVFGLCRR